MSRRARICLVSGQRLEQLCTTKWGRFASISKSRIPLDRERGASSARHSIGLALLHVAGKSTGDDVVFGEPGDLILLGSRTLEGLNFRIDPLIKQLVDAGPAPAAVV